MCCNLQEKQQRIFREAFHFDCNLKSPLQKDSSTLNPTFKCCNNPQSASSNDVIKVLSSPSSTLIAMIMLVSHTTSHQHDMLRNCIDPDK